MEWYLDSAVNRKKYQSGILYQVKLSFKFEKEIKFFSIQIKTETPLLADQHYKKLEKKIL